MANLSQELGRKLPFSLEAEQSVLGSILIDPDVFNSLPGIIKSEDFYLDEHRQIYLAMQKLFIDSRSIDPITLMDMLVRQGVYDIEQSNNYIKLIADIVPSAANVLDYAKIVKNNSLLRQLINVCGEITEDAFTAADDASVIINNAEQKIFDLAQNRNTKEFAHIKDVLVETLGQLQLIQKEGVESLNMPTGFSGVDKVLVGMGKSDLVLVGARPGMGKTSFALNIATSAARRFKESGSNKSVCVFSLEMSNEQLVQRMISSEALVDSYNLRSGMLSDEDWNKIAQAASILSDCDIYIDDTTGITVTGMKAKLRRMKNLGLVVIDYLQLMNSDKKIDNRVNEVAEISRNLKIMAKDFNVPVITCAQLSRGPESRTDKRPMLSDLRDSGAIEQDADIVMFLYRDEYYKGDEDKQNVAEVIIAKNRHGGTGKVDIGWLGKYTKFTTLSDRDEE